jgi:hypothetical protein
MAFCFWGGFFEGELGFVPSPFDKLRAGPAVALDWPVSHSMVRPGHFQLSF